MTFSAYEISIPVMLRGLAVLHGYVDRGEALAGAPGRTAQIVLEARLAPDMLDFADQVRVVCNKVERHSAQLAGRDFPLEQKVEPGFSALRERINRAMAYLEALPETAIVGAETRTFDLKDPLALGWLGGGDFILQLVLPDFFFHLTTAHDILRSLGDGVGKRDYLGPLDFRSTGYS